MGYKQHLIEEVFQVVRTARQASPRYRRERQQVLIHIVNNLITLGIAPATFQALSPSHIRALLNYWHSRGNTVSTVRNKLGILKWFLASQGIKLDWPTSQPLAASLSAATHQARPYVTTALLDQVAHPLTRTLLAFQFYFGLTKLESARLDITTAIRASEIYISRHLAHNHKERYVPIITRTQCDSLDERRHILQGAGCLTDRLPERMLLNLYAAELYHCGITTRVDLRLCYVQCQLAQLASKGVPQHKAYQLIMEALGFQDKHKFRQFAL